MLIPSRPGRKKPHAGPGVVMVEGGGFEPPKASPTDLQSVPFGHSGTPPNLYHVLRLGRSCQSAGERNRTPDRLITNQLLYHLSYAGYSKNAMYNSQSRRSVKSFYCLIAPMAKGQEGKSLYDERPKTSSAGQSLRNDGRDLIYNPAASTQQIPPARSVFGAPMAAATLPAKRLPKGTMPRKAMV